MQIVENSLIRSTKWKSSLINSIWLLVNLYNELKPQMERRQMLLLQGVHCEGPLLLRQHPRQTLEHN